MGGACACNTARSRVCGFAMGGQRGQDRSWFKKKWKPVGRTGNTDENTQANRTLVYSRDGEVQEVNVTTVTVTYCKLWSPGLQLSII